MGHAALEAAARALHLVGEAGVGAAGRNFQVDDGVAGRVQQQLDIVLGIAEGVGPVHAAEYLWFDIVTKQHQCLVERVRTGVEQVAAVVILDALPVPAARVAVECDADLDDATQIAAADDLLHLLEIRGKA
jgi:hypothetical protein